MIDRPTVDRMLDNLNTYVRQLRRLGATPEQAFLADIDKIGSAKYFFTIALECCLDVANHIIASETYRIPKSSADTFVVLIEEGILPKEKEQTFQDMAKFRDRLVHLYEQVDDRLVYRFLQEGLGDFDVFASAVSNVR